VEALSFFVSRKYEAPEKVYNMIEFFLLIFTLGSNPTIEKFEPCNEDFTLLKPKNRVELGIACSLVRGEYAQPYHIRMEIWEDGKKL
jgi:hypothetical protein